jgi:hypothetical protein
MSHQQSFAPNEPETARSKSAKAKPWALWELWPATRHQPARWWRRGRYRTKEEAEAVVVRSCRRTASGAQSFRELREHYRVLHESAGKPQ